MRIGIFLQTLLSWQGGREYTRNLLLSLRAYERECRPGTFEVHLLVTQSQPESSLQEFQTLAHSVHRIRAKLHRAPQAFFNELDSLGIEFVFPLHNPVLGRVRTADWIYDFQHRHLPELFSAGDIQTRDRSFQDLLANADKVVVSSETSRRDLNTFFPGHDDKARVLRFCTFPKDEWIAGNPQAVLERYHLPARYFHLSNQFWIHKNHLTVFEALRQIVSSGVDAQLVCTGSLIDYRNSSYMDDLLAFLHQNGLHTRVRLMGLMPRLDQLQVMRGSLAVLQPSLFEGWSTVLEDARTFGKLTITSSLPVHREQDLPGAAYFPPKEPAALAELMAKAWNSGAPGYDAENEARAFAAAQERTLAFAQKFLEIAAEPAPVQRPRPWRRRYASIRESVRRFIRRK